MSFNGGSKIPILEMELAFGKDMQMWCHAGYFHHLFDFDARLLDLTNRIRMSHLGRNKSVIMRIMLDS